MSRIMWKSFHLCFPTNLTKCSSPPCLPSSAADFPSSTTTTTSGADPATSSFSSSSSNWESDIATDSPLPDFTSIFASRRFFFSSPGPSNAIAHSPRTLSHNYNNATTTAKKKKENRNNYEAATSLATTTASSGPRLLTGGAAVTQHLHSPDPYGDFRRSMQEMIDAMDGRAVEGNEFLHELLLSYLSLNPSDTHELIIRAFADILVSLLSDARRRC